MKHTYPFSHLGVLLIFLFFPLFNYAQSNWFQFNTPQYFNQAATYRSFYRVPVDSVYSIVFGKRKIAANEPWLKQPAYMVGASQTDSLMAADIPGGYYYSIAIAGNQVTGNVHYKSTFDTHIIDLRDLQLVVTNATQPEMLEVYEAGVPVPYNFLMHGYVLSPKKGRVIMVKKGNEMKLFRTGKQYEWYPNRNRRTGNYSGGRADMPRNFLGYLVTNKPMYYPGDTVKYKAYLLYPVAKTPVQEPLRMRLTEYGYYGWNDNTRNGFLLNDSLKQEAPGVYYGEFVLGDSVKPDKDYYLMLHGQNNILSINCKIRVEDYILDEMKISVKAEKNRLFHRGDSIQVFVSSFTTNGLPVLDGSIRMVVLPYNYSGEDSVTFLPDTLVDMTKPADVTGETYMSFSTTGFPDLIMDLRCLISFTNANFEKKDTVLNFSITKMPYYIQVTDSANWFRAELIKNKISINGIGWLLRNRQKIPIRYPYTDSLKPEYGTQCLFSVDAKGNTIETYNYNNRNAAIQFNDDYVQDTAYLSVVNPNHVCVRYTVYAGNKYVGCGALTRDTVIKITKTKGAVVTFLTAYMWGQNVITGKFEIEKYENHLRIDVKKKDVVYPGERDTISINLKDAEGMPVPQTNLTVFAFNAQFKTDNVPAVQPDAITHQGLDKLPKHRLSFYEIHHNNNGTTWSLTKEWLNFCNADTVFYYKNIVFNPTGVAWYSFPVAENKPAQLAVYLHKDGDWLAPAYIDIDYQLQHIAFANYTTNRNALIVSPGNHSIRFRVQNALYEIRNVIVCSGMKTNLFINVADLKKVNADSIHPFVIAYDMPDTLSYSEKDAITRNLLFFRNERYEPAYLIQGNRQYVVGKSNTGYGFGSFSAVGPFNMNDSIGFCQYNNQKIKFSPEYGNVIALRPGMMRVEKSDPYNFVTRNMSAGKEYIYPEKVLDTLYDYGKLSDGVIPVHAAVKKDKVYKLAMFLGNGVPVVNAAILRLVNKTAYGISQLIIYNTADTALPRLYNYYNSRTDIQLEPGRYHIYVSWQDSMASMYEYVVVKHGGINIFPLYRENMMPENLKHVKWLKNYFYYQYDSVKNIRFTDYNTDNPQYKLFKGKAGIAGTVTDNAREAAIGAFVEVLKDERTIASTISDEEGNYLLDLPKGMYTVRIKYAGFHTSVTQNVIVTDGKMTNLNIMLFIDSKQLQDVVVTQYKVPLISSDSRMTITSEEIEKMPTRSTMSVVSQSSGVYRLGDMNIRGSRSDCAVYIIDGIKVYASRGTNLAMGSIDMSDVMQSNRAASYGFYDRGVEPISRAGKTSAVKDFMDKFAGNMILASGMRKDFRDWAIWEPALWTNADGNASFAVRYPDNVTAWKMYVLAMNQKRFAGKVMRFTQAFKPLAAELAAPKFLRYGDTVEVAGKLMNYLSQAYKVKARFVKDTTVVAEDTLTVNNAKVQMFSVAAPAVNSYDTASVAIGYSMQLGNGFTDGESRTLPVYPVGVTESRGMFVDMVRDTTVYSTPDVKNGKYTGVARVFVNGSVLDVMMDELRNLKQYPYGCTEQLTSKLLSIYYEEEVKRLLGDENLNNVKTKREILEKLIAAQNNDGSFGWWRDNYTDYRVTNYVLSTMQKINKDGSLGFIVRKGLDFLSKKVEYMPDRDKIAAMATLSAAGYTLNYRQYMESMDTGRLTVYDRVVIARICKEQKLDYRKLLDSLQKFIHKMPNGTYLGYASYDWYRNDLATTLQYYQLVKDDSIYKVQKEDLVKYFLFKRNNGYYTNTAESGLVLTTLLPDMIKDMNIKNGEPVRASVAITGALNDTVRKFPAMYTVKNIAPRFRFDKTGATPAYVSVVYDYYNINPLPKENVFKVKTVFMKNKDSVTMMKQGERVVLRTTIVTTKETEYVMITVPIPAGCIQVDKNNRTYYENNRENYRDRTLIFCGKLPVGTFTFDVPLQARYKGKFNLSPAKAEMMYYPDEYGNTAVKKIEVK
jgi:alpha-2-macroglobulin